MNGTANDSRPRRIHNAEGLRRLAWLLATLLLISVSAFILARRSDSRALTLPVALGPWTTWSPEFRVNQEARYLVSLEVDRSISSSYLYCLLGGVPFRPPCSIESVVDIQWTLRNGSREVISGSSRNESGFAFGSTVTRTIGQFEGTPGTPYILGFTSMLDGSALAPANPRIVVQVHPEVTKGLFAIGPFVLAFAIPVVGLVVIWLTIWVASAYARPTRT